MLHFLLSPVHFQYPVRPSGTNINRAITVYAHPVIDPLDTGKVIFGRQDVFYDNRVIICADDVGSWDDAPGCDPVPVFIPVPAIGIKVMRWEPETMLVLDDPGKHKITDLAVRAVKKVHYNGGRDSL